MVMGLGEACLVSKRKAKHTVSSSNHYLLPEQSELSLQKGGPERAKLAGPAVILA